MVQVQWTTGITYLPMAHCFIYLAAVLDWVTRPLLKQSLVNHAGGRVLHGSCGGGPGATNLSWHTDLVDPVWRDIASREQLEGLLREAGVNEDSTVILYCDTNTWFAAWGAWVLDGAVPPPSDPNLKQALAHLKGPAMARSSVTEEDVSASLTEHSKRIR